MNAQKVTCPVCLGTDGVQCGQLPSRADRRVFDCKRCGQFEIVKSLMASHYFDVQSSSLTALQRAALSHRLRTARRFGGAPLIVSEWMERANTNLRLPAPPEQAANLVRIIGDHMVETGNGYTINPASDTARVGALNTYMFNQLCEELKAKKIIQPLKHETRAGVLNAQIYGLTLDGWERYEAERHGRFSGNYGFMAMKFHDPVLEKLVSDTVKPAVKDGIGYDLIDLRDVSRAGVIDNILREQIRDAAFILADLTHDNAGAYWEAGYAEGLGKPVVYLCEKSKFDSAKPHFDTNHCTTVLWSQGDTESLKKELVATLRRSLNLFPAAAVEHHL